MRIALIIYSLGPGGAERVASTLVNHWAISGDDVTVITVESREKDFYSLDPRAQRIAMGLGHSNKNWREFLFNNLRRARRFRKIARSSEFDLLLSFGDTTNVQLLLATIGMKVPVVVAEHNDPRKHPIGKIAAFLRRCLYPRARLVVVLTPDIAHWARRVVRRQAVRVIPNPINRQFLRGVGRRERKPTHTVVAMGRMVPQKGFDLLLRAFALCAERNPTWTLRIYGDGDERKRLRDLAADLLIATRVEFNQNTPEPEKVMQESDLFVLSSRYEGFPMVLLEAMACGLPVISFDCLSGPREMISSEIDGVLVPAENVEALAHAMDRLMRNEDERLRLGVRAVAIAERFGLAQVAEMWKNVFTEVLG